MVRSDGRLNHNNGISSRAEKIVTNAVAVNIHIPPMCFCVYIH